jgi:hypothetical protein
MAAKKKVDGRTKKGKALKARQSATAGKRRKGVGAMLKKKRASVAKAKKAVKAQASPRTKVRIVKPKVGEKRTARLRVGPKGKLTPEVKNPRIGSIVVTEQGTIGRLESIDKDGIALLVVVEPTVKDSGVTARTAASKLFKATEGEKRVYGFMARTARSMIEVLTNDETADQVIAVEVSEAVEKVHAETTEAERLAVVADVIKPGRAFNVVECAGESVDSDVRMSPDPEASREATPEA